MICTNNIHIGPFKLINHKPELRCMHCNNRFMDINNRIANDKRQI